MDNTQLKKAYAILNFTKDEILPNIKVNLKDGIITYGGKTNAYFKFLRELVNRNGSHIHAAVLNRKSKMIAGNGIEGLAANNDQLKLNRLVKKIASDYEIFNGYCFDIIYNNDGTFSSLNYIPFQNILRCARTEESDNLFRELKKLKKDAVIKDGDYSLFAYSSNWDDKKIEPELIWGYDAEIKSVKQLYYYISDECESDIYPEPYYATTINWIRLHYLIGEFHFNQADGGYSANHIINFASGIPTDEERESFIKEYKRKYQGTNKSETKLFSWSDGKDTQPTVLPIGGSDSDIRFKDLSEQLKDEIFIGHQITDPQLFGVRVPGTLAGKSEQQDSLDIFQAVYIDYRQNDIETGINEVLGTNYKLNKFLITKNTTNIEPTI